MAFQWIDSLFDIHMIYIAHENPEQELYLVLTSKTEPLKQDLIISM